jgi:hypothetical protein
VKNGGRLEPGDPSRRAFTYFMVGRYPSLIFMGPLDQRGHAESLTAVDHFVQGRQQVLCFLSGPICRTQDHGLGVVGNMHCVGKMRIHGSQSPHCTDLLPQRASLPPCPQRSIRVRVHGAPGGDQVRALHERISRCARPRLH